MFWLKDVLTYFCGHISILSALKWDVSQYCKTNTFWVMFLFVKIKEKEKNGPLKIKNSKICAQHTLHILIWVQKDNRVHGDPIIGSMGYGGLGEYTYNSGSGQLSHN